MYIRSPVNCWFGGRFNSSWVEVPESAPSSPGSALENSKVPSRDSTVTTMTSDARAPSSGAQVNVKFDGFAIACAAVKFVITGAPKTAGEASVRLNERVFGPASRKV